MQLTSAARDARVNAQTVICPNCGDWYEVESAGYQVWLVSPCASQDSFGAAAWEEAAVTPLCPIDGLELVPLRIEAD